MDLAYGAARHWDVASPVWLDEADIGLIRVVALNGVESGFGRWLVRRCHGQR